MPKYFFRKGGTELIAVFLYRDLISRRLESQRDDCDNLMTNMAAGVTCPEGVSLRGRQPGKLGSYPHRRKAHRSRNCDNCRGPFEVDYFVLEALASSQRTAELKLTDFPYYNNICLISNSIIRKIYTMK